jgi:hypothetical protein
MYSSNATRASSLLTCATWSRIDGIGIDMPWRQNAVRKRSSMASSSWDDSGKVARHCLRRAGRNWVEKFMLENGECSLLACPFVASSVTQSEGMRGSELSSKLFRLNNASHHGWCRCFIQGAIFFFAPGFKKIEIALFTNCDIILCNCIIRQDVQGHQGRR